MKQKPVPNVGKVVETQIDKITLKASLALFISSDHLHALFFSNSTSKCELIRNMYTRSLNNRMFTAALHIIAKI